MGAQNIYLTKNVFAAGSAPGITYNPRTERHLEDELNRYLDGGRGGVLTVSGPTETGKTVLVERLLPRDQNIWIEGPDLTMVDVLWDRIVDWLGLYDLVAVGRQGAGGMGRQRGMSAGIPRVGATDATEGDDAPVTAPVREPRQKAVSTIVREVLEATETPVVIDGFQYVADVAKRAIGKSIRTITPLSKVVLIATSQDAFDEVLTKGDTETASRLELDVWSDEELQFIAKRGFEALNMSDLSGIGVMLAASSQGSPCLMQDLCFRYAYSIGVLKTAGDGVAAHPPASWPDFFRAVADRFPSGVFVELLRGPNEPGQRSEVRTFRDGGDTDIYGALLHAVARAGKASVSFRELTWILQRDLTEAPDSETVAAALGELATIAARRPGPGGPAVAFENEALHVLDPFLRFYLRYGTYSLLKNVARSEPEHAESEVTAPPRSAWTIT